MRDMEKMKQELTAALEGFAAMQQEHAALLAENRLDTLPDWVARRREAQLRLKRCLDRFDPSLSAEGSELAGQIRAALHEVLRCERSLAVQAEGLQEEIGEKLRSLRKGKTVLKGYSLRGAAGPGPQYLNSRT